MIQANLQQPKPVFPPFCRACLLGVMLCLFLVPAAAEEHADLSKSEEAWVLAFRDAYAKANTGADLIDKTRLTHLALKPYQLNADQLKEFGAVPIGQQILSSVFQYAQAGAVLTYLHLREVNGERRAIFRLTTEDGLDYYEWYLDTDDQGVTRAWDFESYTSGERMSQSLRRMWVAVVAMLSPEVRRHMGQRNRDLAANINKLNAIRQAVAGQQLQQAIQAYESLPKTVQEERVAMSTIMPVYLESGQQDSYREMLERFLKLHGEASNRELMLMDIYILSGEYDKAFEMVDDLDKRVGGDAYLELTRANVAIYAEDYAKASRFIDKGIERAPRIEDFYWTGIDLATATSDWPRVGLMLDGLIAIGYEFNDLRGLEYYAGFVASDAGKAWLAKNQPEQDQPAENPPALGPLKPAE